jgi:hypothetical protein
MNKAAEGDLLRRHASHAIAIPRAAAVAALVQRAIRELA